MNNTIYTQPNLILESYFALSQLANPESKFSIRHAFTLATDLMPEKEVLYKKIIAYLDALEENLTLPKDRIAFFFNQKQDHSAYDCKGHMFLKACLRVPDLNKLILDTENFTSTERFPHLLECFTNSIASSYENYLHLKETITTEAQLFNSLFTNTELSDADKYELFYIYYHYEPLLMEFITLLKETSRVISPLLSPFKEEIDTLVQTLTCELESNGIDYFNTICGINLGKDSSCYVYPCVSAPLSFSFTSLQTINEFNICFGIYVLPFKALNEQVGLKDKELADFLKALADPSKFQILKLLKDERLYASQLAERLGVSNATISHHMNVLLQLNILLFEKEQNKFYYALDIDKFKNYLNYLNTSFDL